MASSTTNVKIGICRVTFNGVDLGYTKGGVDVDVTTDTHPVNVDQFGTTPIADYIMGRHIKVVAPLAETTIANLAIIMPGTVVTGTTIKKAQVSTGVGINLISIAAPLILHPISNLDTDFSEDLTIPLASTGGALKFAYHLDAERIFNIEFTGFAASDGKLFYIGPAVAT